MNPAAIALALQLLELAIQNEPTIAADLQNIFSSGTPTAAQFAALRSKISGETYGQFVPNSQLPPSETNT